MLDAALESRTPFDPDQPGRLHPRVALRDESFGALAYHFETRRLVFLKSRALVEVVADLAAHPTVRAATAAHVSPGEIDDYLVALGRLHDAGVIDGR